MFFFEKKPAIKKPVIERYAFCKKHGDLSSGNLIGGIHIEPYMNDSEWICPKCFVEFLKENFPVEIKIR